MASPFDTKFIIKNINIHSVEGASCVNIGNNFPAGFESFKKHTQGFGSISGDQNQIEGIRSLLKDGGLIDMINEPDAEGSRWVRELMASKLSDILEGEEEFYIEEESDGELTDEEIDRFFDFDEEEEEAALFDETEMGT